MTEPRPITLVLDEPLDRRFREEAEILAAERPCQVTTLDDCVVEAVTVWLELRRRSRLPVEIRNEITRVLGGEAL